MHQDHGQALDNALISHCLCGRLLSKGRPETHGDPPFVVSHCPCGVGAQLTWQTAEDIDELYRGEYHASNTRHPGCVPYAARYQQDCIVAGIRIERYGEELGEAFETIETALDVGAANGAFVDTLNNVGVDAYGIDPDPSMRREKIATGTLDDTPGLGAHLYDLITLHDVLEHVVDPALMVNQAAELLGPDGLLVVDVPDVWVPEGHHHYKDEHLWFFTSPALRSLIEGAGLAITAEYRPIPGKMVVAGCKR